MEFLDLLFRILPPVVAVVASYAVVKHKTEAHGTEIKDLHRQKEVLQGRVNVLDKDLAVVKSQAAGYDRRLSEALDRIDRAIAASEERVIKHVDFLVERLTDGKS